MSSNPTGLDMKASSLVQPVSGEPDLPNALAGILLDQPGCRYVTKQLVEVLDEFLLEFFESTGQTVEIVDDFLHRFLSEHAEFEFPQAGSTGLGGLLVLYLIARILQPSVLVESGTFVGASLHALRKACPHAELWSFDINFKPLRYRDSTILYCERDWSVPPGPTAKSDRDLVFFDDHISNAKRIIEAHRRGFRYLLFDDAPSFGQIAAYRYPGVPTIPMIIDPDLPRISISWVHQGSRLRYDHDPKQCEKARELIDLAAAVPNLRPASGLQAGDKWLVRLKP